MQIGCGPRQVGVRGLLTPDAKNKNKIIIAELLNGFGTYEHLTQKTKQLLPKCEMRLVSIWGSAFTNTQLKNKNAK